MSADDSQNRYNPVSKGFHWVSALIVLGLLPLGYFMTSLEFSTFKLDLYAWHKSFGTLLLILVALRILWRLRKGTPPHLDAHTRWEVVLAKIVHILLYFGLIGMPVTGWLMTSFGQFPHAFFGLNIPPITPKNEDLYHLMGDLHEMCSYALIGAIVLHAAGAFKHHLIDKDITLLRMLPLKAQKIGVFLAAFILTLSLTFSAGFYLQSVLKQDKYKEAGSIEVASQVEDVVSEETDTSTATLEVPEGAYVHHHEDGSVHVHHHHDHSHDSEEDKDASVQSWAIDTSQSTIGFSATAQKAAFDGNFNEFGGEIAFDPENLSGSHVRIEVNVASVSTGSDSRDGYLMDAAWLNEKEYSQAVFEADQFSKTDNGYVAEGILTMRGVSLPVSFPFTLSISGEGADRVAKAAGSFSINRLDYGVGEGDWASEKTASHQIEIAVSITATAI